MTSLTTRHAARLAVFDVFGWTVLQTMEEATATSASVAIGSRPDLVPSANWCQVSSTDLCQFLGFVAVVGDALQVPIVEDGLHGAVREDDIWGLLGAILFVLQQNAFEP